MLQSGVVQCLQPFQRQPVYTQQTFAGCLQSGSGQVKQLGLYGQTPGAASWAGVTVLRPALGILCGLWRVLAGVLLVDMSG